METAFGEIEAIFCTYIALGSGEILATITFARVIALKGIWVRAEWITGTWLAASFAEFIPHGLARVTLEACDTWTTKALTCCGVTCLIVGAERIAFASFTASAGLDIPVAVLALIATSVFDVGPALTLSGVEVTLQWLVELWLLVGSEWGAVTGVAFLRTQGITPVLW